MESSGIHSGSTKSSGGSSHWFTKAILKYARLLPCDTMLLHLFHKFKTHYINGVHFGDHQLRWIRVHWSAPVKTQQCFCLCPYVCYHVRCDFHEIVISLKIAIWLKHLFPPPRTDEFSHVDSKWSCWIVREDLKHWLCVHHVASSVSSLYLNGERKHTNLFLFHWTTVCSHTQYRISVQSVFLDRNTTCPSQFSFFSL